MTLEIVREGDNAQFAEMKVIMPSLVRTRGDAACVIAMNTMLATAPPGNIDITSSRKGRTGRTELPW